MLSASRVVPAQPGNGVNPDVALPFDPVVGVAGSAIGAFATTLVIGAILVAVAPELLERTMTAARQDPVGSFVYGIVCLVFVLLVAIVLVFTIIGVVVAIPFLVAAYLIWAAGATVAFVAVAVRLVGREDGWIKPLLVAASLNGLLALTAIGGLVSFVVGAVGFGAVLRDWLE